MQILKYKLAQFKSRDVDAVMGELEQELGVMLHVADPKKPNNVQGYILTETVDDGSQDATIEVHLYEAVDVAIRIHKPHNLDVAIAKDKARNVLAKRGFVTDG